MQRERCDARGAQQSGAGEHDRCQDRADDKALLRTARRSPVLRACADAPSDLRTSVRHAGNPAYGCRVPVRRRGLVSVVRIVAGY